MTQIEPTDTFGVTRWIVTLDGFYMCTCLTYNEAVEMAEILSEVF